MFSKRDENLTDWEMRILDENSSVLYNQKYTGASNFWI
jgi:hypothetical protein